MAHESKADKRERRQDEADEEAAEIRAEDRAEARQHKAVEPHVAPASSTIRMKFDGHFVGKEKRVPLPIPLIAQGDATGEALIFTREDEHVGPAFCDVPPQWATKLLEIGGHFKKAEKGE